MNFALELDDELQIWRMQRGIDPKTDWAHRHLRSVRKASLVLGSPRVIRLRVQSDLTVLKLFLVGLFVALYGYSVRQLDLTGSIPILHCYSWLS